MQLSAQTVRLGATPRDKREAIEMAGAALVDAGLIERDYIQSMMARELQANTFLGRGIAIPHGMAPDRHLIKHTGVGVVQIPRGVEWNNGERVDLVVAIAAKSDEHLQILAALTDVLDDEQLIRQLSQTKDVGDILSALNGTRPDSSVESHSIEGNCVEVRVVGSAGLHARPATRLVKIASRFGGEISVEYGGKRGSAKAVLSLLKLGVPGGAWVRIVADGPDAAQTLAALKTAIESGLGEEGHEVVSPTLIQTPAFVSPSGSSFLEGLKGSPGLAIAPLFFLRDEVFEVLDTAENLASEREKLFMALQKAGEELQALSSSLENRGAHEEAAIFSAHLAFLDDSELRSSTQTLLEAGHGAAWSWHTIIQSRAEEMLGNSNALLAQRSSDLRDVGTRVLRFLGVEGKGGGELPDHPVILVARDLTPSQTANLDQTRVLGICTAEGGPTSHTAILARALNLPAVIGVGEELLRLDKIASPVILDGDGGRLYPHPTEADVCAARRIRDEQNQQHDVEFAARFRPALMRDGHRVEIVANIGTPPEAAQAVDNGAEGVGLLRSEFLFLGKESAPTEGEQFAALSAMTAALGGLPLTVRILDIGGDKTVPYLSLPHEANPFLGVRGARLALRQPELFRTQLRAIFRASETGPLRILFPMIGTLEEWRTVRDFAEEVRQEVGALELEYGVMVEVPSAALMARELAQEVDFFSIGTNDLTQYTLAVDRLHPELNKDADSLHPAVLRLIRMVVEAAREAGKSVSVCGGTSDDPFSALLLAGLGVNSLSMSIPAIPTVKAAFRGADFKGVERLAERALKCRTAPEVRSLGGIQ